MTKNNPLKELNENSTPVGSTGFTVNGYKCQSFNDLVGKLLTLADTLGLDEKQGEAYKSLVRQTMWDFWDKPQYSYNYENDKLKM